jgi:transcriptional regulator GlxA family with amidase domain
MTQTTLRVAVCLFPRVTTTDYQGPVEVMGILSAKNRQRAVLGVSKDLPDLFIEFTYLSHTMDPVEPTAGPRVLPSLTYDDAQEQFDIILVPGGKHESHSATAAQASSRTERQSTEGVPGIYQETGPGSKVHIDRVHRLIGPGTDWPLERQTRNHEQGCFSYRTGRTFNLR